MSRDFTRMQNDYLDPEPHMRAQEDAALGEAIATCMKRILEEHGAATLGDLQRNCYKYTDAGIAISFELFDGTRIYTGNPRAYEKGLESAVAKVGVSSIVEGSDAEVPLQWIDLVAYASPDSDHGEDFATKAADAFGELCDEVNDEACCLQSGLDYRVRRYHN